MGDSTQTWPRLLSKLLAGTDLQAADTAWAMDQMMSGAASPVQIAGFLIALRAKGETVDELRGLADMMVRHAVPIQVPGATLDIVGTGGDGAHTVNISTMSAIVAAGAGARVVKHGNRAASSKSGAADVLEALGISLDLEPSDVARVALDAGITFCFAQTFHPSMRHAGATRSELGVPTVFNVMGPLTNPARPRYSAVGAASAQVAPLMAGVFADRDRSAAVFRGDDGLDELTVTTTSTVWWVQDGQISRHQVDPSKFGIASSPIEALRGGDAAHNAQVVREVLDGRTGAARDAVVLNAGIALAVVGIESGPGRFGNAADFEDALGVGLERAATSIDSGSAASVVKRWVAATKSP
ncbi:anthranilate phosphoribosyltransferase [Leekyejoonella antrihumi]|uniref:Anthranilate phosphoribosyltransferase n=1 Tax=Leekyejoonella antrihumi TaxID=1660198 RepID=A0A563E454_9MICO|nr:anthranilate phosphoribosyltransferase [Leekyejoonella antrihumi]TWP36991.1 anthranilate phosphoribosyltransferase [Leekyejoonella antrihumi]